MGAEYNKFSSIDNLELAWMRIKTDSSNVSYKNYYRNLFSVYENTYKENLKILSERLKGHSYTPSDILRFYLPKQSGLHRPITFLHLDDLIVYQAFGNVILESCIDQRDDLENIHVFSNILNRDTNKKIFLFKKWQEGYIRFIRKIKDYYYSKNKWVAHFDLASYYDTIDHGGLVNDFSEDSDFKDLFQNCLSKWSTHRDTELKHGIPQGPTTSNLLSEIYFLSIDKALSRNGFKYVRYVDDIKIFGESREEVLDGIILLEEECKEKGLIPQITKHEIIKASAITQATGKLASLKTYEKTEIISDSRETFKHFKAATKMSKFDSSKVDYILKAGKRHKFVLNWVLRNLKTHPELVDGFYQYLLKYSYDSIIGKKIYKRALSNPTKYKYVEGKYWDLLSYFEFDDGFKDSILDFVITRLDSIEHDYSLKLGLYKFLCFHKGELIFEYLKNESSALIQMMIIPYLPMIEEEYEAFLPTLNNSSNYEPVLIAVNEVISKNKLYMLTKIDFLKNDPTCVVGNCLGKRDNIDSIGQIMKETYDVPYCDKWIKLLDSEYKHANNLLFSSLSSYSIDGNSWINYKDTFNEMLLRNFISLLELECPNTNWPSLTHQNGKKTHYGSLLDKTTNLYKEYPRIIEPFRELHLRRNTTPTSHAYDIKSNLTSFVSATEKKEHFDGLKTSYDLLIKEIEEIFINTVIQ